MDSAIIVEMMRRGPMRLISVLGILLFLVPYFLTPTIADGVIINPWGIPFEEEAQTAVILWDRGMETLALHVSSSAPEGSFWLVPIPSKPDMIVVSHARTMTLSGYDRGIEAWSAFKSRVACWYAGMSLISQIYPVVSPLSWALLYKLWPRKPPIYMPLVGEISSAFRGDEGVSVHEVIESYGLTSYVVTAEDAESFYQFLSKIGVKVPEEAKGVLKEYIGKGFSFVVSRVEQAIILRNSPTNSTGSEEYEIWEPMPPIRPMGLGVVITFPIDKPFYPLVPTSVYGSKIIPVRLYVMGLWEAQDLGQPLSTFTKIEHFVEAHLSIYTDPVIKPLSGTEISEYTLITMDSPSKYLKSDLNFRPASSVRFAVESPWFIGFAVFVLCSIIASAGASVILGRKSGSDVLKAGLLGLGNLLTIAGYYYIVSRALGKERHSTSNWKALVVSSVITFMLLLGGISAIGLWLVIPNYSNWSLVLTPLLSILALLPPVATSWIYWRLNASSIALGANRTVIPVNGKAAKQTLLFSIIFIIVFATVTHAFISFV